MADSLQEELLAIPGIDGADFAGGVIAPEGVRVRLAAGADPIRVGEDVRKVLAEHGLRSQMTSPPVAPDVPPLPPPVVSPPVVAMPYPEESTETLVVAVPGSAHEAASTEEAMAAALVPEVKALEAEPSRDAVTAVTSDPVQAGLHSVAVEEAIGGLTVVATRTDGVAVQRPARDSVKGLDAAVVAAVSELADNAARPRLIGVFDAAAEGVTVVTVVVEADDGSLRSGSAVVGGGRAFGVARATWRALSAPV